jgi:hypothetical protein
MTRIGEIPDHGGSEHHFGLDLKVIRRIRGRIAQHIGLVLLARKIQRVCMESLGRVCQIDK